MVIEISLIQVGKGVEKRGEALPFPLVIYTLLLVFDLAHPKTVNLNAFRLMSSVAQKLWGRYPLPLDAAGLVGIGSRLYRQPWHLHQFFTPRCYSENVVLSAAFVLATTAMIRHATD